MSEDKETKTQPEQAPPAKQDQAESGHAAQVSPRRGGRALAAVALVLVLFVAAAVGGGAYYFHLQLTELTRLAESRASDEELQALSERLGTQTQALREQVENLAGRTSSQTENLAQFREELQNLRQDQRGLAGRMDHFAELAESRRYEWARSEAAYLASVALTRLRFHRDVDSALQALKEADTLLAGFGGRTVDARQGLRQAIDALLAVDRPDPGAISDRLLGLSASIPELPLRGEPRSERDESDAANDVEPQADGWRAGVTRAWQRFRESLAELVVIKRAEDQPPLISREQRFFLTRNLQLQMETARAALVQREAGLYRDSLREAERWLTRYYDTDKAVVRTVRSELQSLLEADVATQLPAIRPMLEPLLGSGDGDGDA